MNLSLLLTTQTLAAPAPFPKRPIPPPDEPVWPRGFSDEDRQLGVDDLRGPKGPGAVIEFPNAEVDPEPPGKAKEVDPEPPDNGAPRIGPPKP
jgi:hypothetical protein